MNCMKNIQKETEALAKKVITIQRFRDSSEEQ